jgi:hypothetical protein
MPELTSDAVLELWEKGMSLHPLDRGLLALSVANPSVRGGVADLPLGHRNRALLDLHASWFGPQLAGWTSCPSCGEKVEFELDARELAVSADGRRPQDSVTVGAHSFRLPTSRDLAHVIGLNPPGSAAAGLLDRCRIGGPENPGWTRDVIEAVQDSLASADPLAETRLALSCPSCLREWDDVFDVGCFLWAEVESRARRVLCEVHALASVYGWSESETLALSDARRAMYLEIVHG